MLGDRIALQADQAELPAQILLRGKCERHQDTNLGDAHRKPPADAYEERTDTFMELFGTGDNGTDCTDVLCGLLQPVQPSGEGLGDHAGNRPRRTGSIKSFFMEGLKNKIKEANLDLICHSLLPWGNQKFYRTLIIDNHPHWFELAKEKWAKVYQTTGTPCSCWMCRGEEYNRREYKRETLRIIRESME